MSEEQKKIHGHDLDIQNEDHHEIKHIVEGWKGHEDDFRDMRHALEKDPNHKIYIGNVVFEKKDGKLVLRKSSTQHY